MQTITSGQESPKKQKQVVDEFDISPVRNFELVKLAEIQCKNFKGRVVQTDILASGYFEPIQP